MKGKADRVKFFKVFKSGAGNIIEQPLSLFNKFLFFTTIKLNQIPDILLLLMKKSNDIIIHQIYYLII
ncbi:MAG: hypothetical protein EA393_15585 [Bacteroidetes bacterium]|nr:MAG: hypothetical protein EA393_15585 [Bacteroidota bacterium]